VICRLQESTLGIPYEPGTAQADAYFTEQDEGELIWRALDAASVGGFVRNLPNSTDTILDNKGAALSAGQKQRIALARAILSERPVLLLDEATSTLDSQTETSVTKALAATRKEQITIIVSHRLSSIKSANRIIVIVDGAIAQEGSHRELIKSGGAYRRIFQDQFRLMDENAQVHFDHHSR